MTDDREYRAGLFSGIVAGVMVIALTAMAFMSFDPAQAEPPRYAGFKAVTIASADGVIRHLGR